MLMSIAMDWSSFWKIATWLSLALKRKKNLRYLEALAEDNGLEPVALDMQQAAIDTTAVRVTENVDVAPLTIEAN